MAKNAECINKRFKGFLMKTEILLLLSAWDILCFKYIDGNQHYFITPPDRFKNLIK